MALHVTNIGELKNSKLKLMEAKESYQNTLNELKNAVKSTEISWQGEDAYNFRQKLLTIINNDLKVEIDEIDFEIKFLDKILIVLENAQQEVKKRLNG